MVDGDDALELRNATGANVMVPGYEGEPYLRFLKSGRVEVNVNSPAKYLNEERYGGVAILEDRGREERRRSGSSSHRAASTNGTSTGSTGCPRSSPRG